MGSYVTRWGHTKNSENSKKSPTIKVIYTVKACEFGYPRKVRNVNRLSDDPLTTFKTLHMKFNITEKTNKYQNLRLQT